MAALAPIDSNTLIYTKRRRNIRGMQPMTTSGMIDATGSGRVVPLQQDCRKCRPGTLVFCNRGGVIQRVLCPASGIVCCDPLP
jgi:hypothetical protein